MTKSAGTRGVITVLGWALFLWCQLLVGCGLPEVHAGRVTDRPTCRLNNPELEESSGLAYSYRYDGLLYTHNDSGDSARIFAFDTQCHERGMFEIKGVEALDWEDMCSFEIEGKPYLLLADTGDNLERRKFYTLYIIEEPEIGPSHNGTPTMVELAGVIQFVYPDGPHNCESVAVDPDSMTILLATKRERGWARLYGIPLSAVQEQGVIAAKALATLPVRRATAMDMSRSGRHLVVLTYDNAYEFSRQGHEPWIKAFVRPPKVLSMPSREQGEAICYSPDGMELFLTSEGQPALFWMVPREFDQP
jgi:uncharacterized protein YciU (UPF0263 family)